MNYKFTLFSALFVLWFSVVSGQETKIYGKVENAAGYVIKLKTYSDFISMKMWVIDECVVQQDGSFELKSTLSSTQVFILQIGFQKSEIYLEPNKTYQLSIKYDKDREQITFVNNPYLEYQFIDLPKDDLNNQISEFNFRADQFLLANFNRIYKNKERKLILDFGTEIKQLFDNPSDYLRVYIDFRLASLELNSGLQNRESVYKIHMQNKPFYALHDEYMRFFNQLFEKYLSVPNKYFDQNVLLQKIYENADLESIMALLKKDSMLENQKFREMALLKILYDLYFIPSGNHASIIKLIDEIGGSTDNSDHTQIAKNMVQQLTYLRPGTKAPAYIPEDLEGNNFNIPNQSKQITFVQFFTIPCNDCIREMDSIAELYQLYAEDVQFISVGIKTAPNTLLDLTKKYPWKILHTNDVFGIAEIYQINSLPAYFLIDSEGVIRQNPALVPWNGFSQFFKSEFKHLKL